MEKQSAPRRTIVLAALVVFLTAAAFVAAFYVFDGASVVSDGYASARRYVEGWLEQDAAPSVPSTTTPSATLRLPPGMPEEFALRLWQEQVDSQDNITRLVEGEVAALDIDKVVVDGDDADLDVTATLKSGGSVSGVLRMKRFDDVWYVASLSGLDSDPSAAGRQTPLPSVDQVDVRLLNTLIAEHQKSAEITQEYIDGKVSRVAVDAIKQGVETTEISIAMSEDHEESSARLIAIRSSAKGAPIWFLARFVKTGSDSKTAP